MIQDRAAARFASVATAIFDFLHSRFGMTVVEGGETRVVYSKGSLFVAIFWARRSYEVGVEIGQWDESVGSTRNHEIPLQFLVAELVPELSRTRPPWIASNPAGLAVALGALAEQAEAVLQVMLATPALIPGMYAKWLDRNKVGADAFGAASLRERAEIAWHEHDYLSTIREYSSILKNYPSVALKASEIARLKYATNHVDDT